MTATDELRRMLDERGVEWMPSAWDRSTETYWKTADGNGCLAIQGETKLRLSFADYLTPEQAIEATLGRRTTTRHGKFRTKYGRSVPCCECCGYGIGDERWHYCPSCGAEVVE